MSQKLYKYCGFPIEMATNKSVEIVYCWQDNETGLNHLTYVWENVIKMSPAKQIAIVAHSYGGRNTIDLVISATVILDLRVV